MSNYVIQLALICQTDSDAVIKIKICRNIFGRYCCAVCPRRHIHSLANVTDCRYDYCQTMSCNCELACANDMRSELNTE